VTGTVVASTHNQEIEEQISNAKSRAAAAERQRLALEQQEKDGFQRVGMRLALARMIR
jgi:hypothetical protein